MRSASGSYEIILSMWSEVIMLSKLLVDLRLSKKLKRTNVTRAFTLKNDSKRWIFEPGYSSIQFFGTIFA